MSDESKGNVGDALKGAAELAKAVPVYQDAIQPAAREAGEALKPAGRDVGDAVATLTGAVMMALAPLRAAVWGWEQIEGIVIPEVGRRFKEKLHRLISPSPEVAGPALESLRFTGGNPTLREMYINLLATAMDKETATKAHPAFADIIKQLTPDEARIVQYLHTTGGVKMEGMERGFQSDLQKKLAGPAGCEHPELIRVYIDNMDRLQLVGRMRTLTNESRASGRVLTYSYTASLSCFGLQFCDACLADQTGSEPGTGHPPSCPPDGTATADAT